MTAPGALLELLDGAAVGIFGILLSAAFCPIRWTEKKRWALAGCTAGLLALQGIFYFGASPTAAQYLYPLITHLPLYVVLVLLSGQKVWPLVAVLTAYLCCQVRRWTALAVALFFPQHLLVQPVAELLFTLPLLLLFIRFLAPSMRQLSHYPASVQCQFGIVPLVGYLFDYITHVYTSLLSEANPAAVEFMFFVCCAAFLCSILRASRVERQRIQMEQLQTSLNLQVTQAMREIEALRLSQQRASTYRHDLRHHMQFLAGCIENGRTEQALGYIRSVCSEIEAGKVTAYCENEAANLIFSAFADRAAKAGVQFTVQAGMSQALPVSESDLCVLLSNALENALHAGQRQRANQQGGLDMEIFDHYSGYARPLATLSGGESFLASLSLALGLADVVQACAGGVRLDTMFIDEGFGTLDSETLDVALKALFELQKSGRLIGIISHVEELRSRIPARLEVTKTKSGGSTAHFELGTAES